MNNSEVPETEAEEQGITIKDILYIIKKHLIAILVIVALALAAGLVFTVVEKKEYYSTATLLASPMESAPGESVSYNYLDYISRTYTELLTDEIITTKTSERLKSNHNIDITPGAIKKGLNVTASSLIINVKFTYEVSGESDIAATKTVVDEVINSMMDLVNDVDGDSKPTYKLLYGNLAPLSEGSAPVRSSKTLRNILIFFAAGLALAVIYVILFELLDDRFRTNEEVERSLNLPVHASIPFYNFSVHEDGARSGPAKPVGRKRYSMEPNENYRIITITEPMSEASESYRRLKVGIEFSSIDSDCRVLQVCSSRQGEGKTLTALNLATTIKEDKKSVIVVDLDLRRPKIHRSFRISNTDGLTDYLAGKISLDTAIKHKDGFPDILNSGTKTSHPTTILASASLGELFEKLRGMYDYIVVDCPPILATSDAVLVSRYTDATLFIVNQQITSKMEAREAVKALRKNRVNLLGAAVCSAKGGTHRYYYYGGYSDKNADGAKTSAPSSESESTTSEEENKG